MVGEFDPVQFGRLIEQVEHTSAKMDQTMEKMDRFIEATETRFGKIETDGATKKGMILGTLAGGAMGGASLAEIIKHWFK
jgi:hypothetical protein